ncbi:MAG TPA: redox-sensing transcriptional repressor Rex [Thermoanaerobacterales bacterium]|uniref:redox-sensing transcriptional repressor Rex n=1 Tax=Tepidanaerobacter sp. GT38 TaxID=2722793 RepID=UPI00178DFD95|nr:redox-sensing transcriptional repressor Rex [Tepidanaerobacter sp. GT38]HHY41741.1 redox-sensing transcriptional repressor Rex [Thermoanaerobacterales bacterium]
MELPGEIKKVSIAVIKRLPKYYKCLGELLRKNVERVSSQELSKLLGFTASQIRQDLNNFGEFGQQGYGYNVAQLYTEISKILGINTSHKMVIIGAGNLGQALANYAGFAAHGFNIIAIFDTNPSLVGRKINNIPIYPVEDMEYYINRNDVDIAVLTVPQDQTEKIVKILTNTDVRGIWNFTPVDINIDDKDIAVENVHLIDSLLTLSYHINESWLQERFLRQKRNGQFVNSKNKAYMVK